MKGRVDIINSTLGKALGGAAGGYTTGPYELIDLLKQKSRPYLLYVKFIFGIAFHFIRMTKIQNIKS